MWRKGDRQARSRLVPAVACGAVGAAGGAVVAAGHLGVLSLVLADGEAQLVFIVSAWAHAIIGVLVGVAVGASRGWPQHGARRTARAIGAALVASSSVLWLLLEFFPESGAASLLVPASALAAALIGFRDQPKHGMTAARRGRPGASPP